MQRLDLIGLNLTADQKRVIQNKLDQLSERAPFTSTIHLSLEKRKSCIKGIMKISSFSSNFHSTKVASDPIQTYLLLQDEIDGQLLEWKRNRFRDPAFNDVREIASKQACA